MYSLCSFFLKKGNLTQESVRSGVISKVGTGGVMKENLCSSIGSKQIRKDEGFLPLKRHLPSELRGKCSMLYLSSKVWHIASEIR